jgi:hypothetical protein
MRKLALVLLLATAVFGMTYPALAAMTNLGEDLPLVPSQNVLTPDDGRSGRMLYCPSEADDPGYRAQIAALTGDVVDYFDTRIANPGAALLNTYDCVYVWANYAFFDNVGLGDQLAAFVDQGGTVILGSFCTYTSGNYLSGMIMTAAYSPVWSPSGTNHFVSSNYAGDGTTCIHTGVTFYECTYRDYLTLQGTGIVDGHYVDGEIAHAYRPDFKVIYSNGSGGAPLSGTGDWARLVANACMCTGPTPVEQSTWGQIKSRF